MTRDNLTAIKRRQEKSYKNFNLAVYCPVGDLNAIKELDSFDARFKYTFEGLKIGRVYLEDFRGCETIEKSHLLKIKDYFEKQGIKTCGGITTCSANSPLFGFASLCYSTEQGQQMIRDAVKMNAEIFDEIIFDDFYFLNCRCKACIEKKGDLSWKEFRLKQKRWVTEELVMKVAKETRPDINVIVKFPQWYEDFNETGYDLETDTELFDSIYTGTETRNPSYSQQHLPKYLSYNTMRLYGSNKPGVNLGGWFDPYECNYNLTSYLEQAYLTLFGKAEEMTLFCLGSLMNDPQYRVFPGALKKLCDEVDEYLGMLGNPVGAGAYHPTNGRGENNIHSYLGQCGVPMEMSLLYPKDSRVVFLAESAAADNNIIAKMKNSLLSGHDVVVTSGFVKAVGDAFYEFGRVTVTDKKAFVNKYGISPNHGVNILGQYIGDSQIIIPQLDYHTNDVWEMAGAYGSDNNFPIVLSFAYGDGVVSVITVPDDMGDIYHYPREVLKVIRDLFAKVSGVVLDSPAGVQLFVYDNDYAIVHSDLPCQEIINVSLPKSVKKVECLNLHHAFTPAPASQTNGTYGEASQEIKVMLEPGVNQVVKLVK